MSVSELCFTPATDLVRMIRRKDVSVTEVMEAHLAQVDRVNPAVNAIVTYHPDQALDGARKADEAIARNEARGPLFGLPIAHKDLVLTKGVR
ncbi:MAG: amidase family protein, partial [Gemmatimonadota bacterium]|nr:amidase family protein [Gemmatimonadota bacterium]